MYDITVVYVTQFQIYSYLVQCYTKSIGCQKAFEPVLFIVRYYKTTHYIIHKLIYKILYISSSADGGFQS